MAVSCPHRVSVTILAGSRYSSRFNRRSLVPTCSNLFARCSGSNRGSHRSRSSSDRYMNSWNAFTNVRLVKKNARSVAFLSLPSVGENRALHFRSLREFPRPSGHARASRLIEAPMRLHRRVRLGLLWHHDTSARIGPHQASPRPTSRPFGLSVRSV